MGRKRIKKVMLSAEVLPEFAERLDKAIDREYKTDSGVGGKRNRSHVVRLTTEKWVTESEKKHAESCG